MTCSDKILSEFMGASCKDITASKKDNDYPQKYS